MIDDVSPVPVIVVAANDGADGVPTIVNAAGEMTEASAAAALGGITTTNRYLLGDASPRFGILPNSTSGSVNAQKRILMHTATTDGAGDYGPLAIVAALASYRACMRIDYIYADGTDPAYTFTMAATSGLEGIATLNCASVANTIGPDYERGIYYRVNVDGETLTLQLANAGNVITYTFFGVYWYET